MAAIALEILEGFGLEVDWAETGDDALKFLQADDFDLMLTDVVMPGGMSGIDLAREAAARGSGNNAGEGSMLGGFADMIGGNR